MKRFVLIVALLLCAVVIISCMANDDPSDAGTGSDGIGTEESKSMTGRPSGHVQQDFVFVNGTLYVYDDGGEHETLPDGFTLAGEIVYNDLFHQPVEELNASYVDVGTPVYVTEDNNEEIYIYRYDHYYRFRVGSYYR